MTDQELEQRIRAFYRAEVDDRMSAPAQLRTENATLALAAARSRGWFPASWGLPRMTRIVPFALGAAAVVVTLAIGVGLLLRPPAYVGPPASPAATPSVTSTGRAAAWTATGTMSAFGGNTAVLLPDGRVLAFVTGAPDTAELYDPASGIWTATGTMLGIGGSTATVLASGKVLVTGNSPTSAQLYDPATGSWAATGAMIEAGGSTATLLADGTVLVTGAGAGFTQVYHPATETWTSAGNMVEVRDGGGYTATLLSDGRVLVVGGQTGGKTTLATAEVYDPDSRSWAPTGEMDAVRHWHTATLLSDGRVLVAGGFGANELSDPALPSAELYDPRSGTWTAAGDTVQARGFHTATLLLNGLVLVAGGNGRGMDVLASADLYDPDSDTWTATASLIDGRIGHSATLLLNGEVLVAGGSGADGQPLARAELYDPGSGS